MSITRRCHRRFFVAFCFGIFSFSAFIFVLFSLSAFARFSSFYVLFFFFHRTTIVLFVSDLTSVLLPIGLFFSVCFFGIRCRFSLVFPIRLIYRSEMSGFSQIPHFANSTLQKWLNFAFFRAYACVYHFFLVILRRKIYSSRFLENLVL